MIKEKIKKNLPIILVLIVAAVVFVVLPLLGQYRIKHGQLKKYTDSQMDEYYYGKFTKTNRIYKDGKMLSEIGEYEFEPKAIAKADTCIFALDKQSCCIFSINNEGEIIKKVGGIGNGRLEFLNPEDITFANDKLYVLDSQNERIEILSDDLEYLDEIKLPEKSNKYKTLNSIAVDDKENVFMSCSDVGYSAVLVYVKEKAEFREFGKNFKGTLCSDNGEVYAITVGSVFESKSEKRIGWRSGFNDLYSVSVNGINRLCELPYASTILDFVITNGKIICFNGCYRTIDTFGTDGKYLYSFSNIGGEDVDKSCIWIDNLGNIYVGYQNKILHYGDSL